MMKYLSQNRGGFTLIELLVVMTIMGLMGSLSVASYRSMRRGMEESGVLRNASQFIRLAYQRAQIDRNPVNVYFWNETRQVETDDTELKVIGRAAAVRRAGRVTRRDGQKLVDEFGDLAIDSYKNDEGEEVENGNYANDIGRYMYRINGDETSFSRSIVSQTTVQDDGGEMQFISYPASEYTNESGKRLKEYAYYVRDWGGITDWEVGDAYGFEFAEFDLPQGYLYGNSYSKSVESPNVSQAVFSFNPNSGNDGGGRTVSVSALRPDASGVLAVTSIGSTTAPSAAQDQQNK